MGGAPDRDRRSELLRAVFLDAVGAVRPDRLLADGPWESAVTRRLDAYRRVILVAMGKAALPAASVVERRLGDRITNGLVIVPHGYGSSLPEEVAPPVRARILEAGHPVPDAAGVRASKAVMTLLRGADRDDLVIAFVSGGGSALLPAPPPGVRLKEVATIHQALLHSGAPIDEVNTVRRALSGLAGGGMAAIAAPAEVVGLVLSDVPGDDVSVVAGGPLTPSRTTAADALQVLAARAIRAPSSIVRVLQGRGRSRGRSVEARTVLIGSNDDLCEAAARAARRRGLAPRVHGSDLHGEAREVGRRIGLHAGSTPAGVVGIWGGETTVTVTGSGRGGRSQELALAAALALQEAGTAGGTVLAAGSDGVDGPTAAAGAVADEATVARGESGGLSARERLADNDAFGFFERTGGLVVTGPTHTNVMDLVLAVGADPRHD